LKNKAHYTNTVDISDSIKILTASMDKRLTRVPHTGGLKFKFRGRPNLTQRCKRFATASTSTQIAVLP